MQTPFDGTIAELVVNLDEVGASDWEDQRTREVIAPAIIDPDAVSHSVSWTFKHITLLVCVSAGADSLWMMLVLGQAISKDLWTRAYEETSTSFTIPGSF
jgi:hypothetical protein